MLCIDVGDSVGRVLKRYRFLGGLPTFLQESHHFEARRVRKKCSARSLETDRKR
jgi:hypothetical protein